MLKKLWMLVLLSLTSTQVFAEYGTYTGINLAYNLTSYVLQDTTLTNYKLNSQYSSVGLFVGDGAQIYPHFYLGAELFGNFGSGSTPYQLINNGQSYQKLNSTYSVGADAMPGYIVNDCSLIYGRLGIVQTRIVIRGYITPLSTIGDQITSPRFFPGLRVGLGYEHTLSRFIKVRAEYIHTFYKPLYVMDNAGWRDRLAPSSNQVGVALAYQFL